MEDTGRAQLTWSLTPHSPAEEVAILAVVAPETGTQHGRVDRFAPSPPGAANRHLVGQGLLLSRTMLSNHGLPYVGRFACGWHRLATTDPRTAHAQVYVSGLRGDG